MTKKEVLNNQADEIMDSFDFKKVQEVMEHLDWTWQDDKTPPDESEIRRNARKLLRLAIEQDESMFTGGFAVAIRSGEESGKKWAAIDLAFEIESTFNDGEDYD